MLIVSFDGISVTPMREEGNKSFSDGDCLKGTESVVYKAAKILVHSHSKALSVGIPKLVQSTIDTLIVDEKDNVTPITPAQDEIQSRIDLIRGFNSSEVEKSLEASGLINTGTEDEPIYPKYVVEDDEYIEGNDNWKYNKTRSQIASELRKSDVNGDEILDLTDEESEDLLIAEYKTKVATATINSSINDCCKVPVLSNEVESGNCTYDFDTKTITDSSADYVTVNIIENDLVDLNNCLYKVDSVTDLNNLILKTGPSEDITEAISYKILKSAFMSQFDYINS